MNGWYGLGLVFVLAMLRWLSLLVVRNVAHQRTRTVDLFQKYDSGQLMGKSHGGNAQQQVGPLPDAIVQPAVSPENEGHAVRLRDRQSLEPLRKLQRIHRLPSLIEGHRVAIRGDGL